ncbi:tripartite tricarboxylate transporter substrate binding protein [uncultured Desulfovibrio sp.]|uniref:Bug family tripartite tricarboxylate transporter substrate binding protein n=1 Tax=uncultured Desulfovibrio sp. TaxID=167968 RepID=UPI00263834E4|nr:tripartite tricarboxylate transporter substrate binding protein [uncultured Desulfovibrio sp.]
MRHAILRVVLMVLACCCLCSPAAAGADYPRKPVTVYIPLGVGDTADVFVRVITPYMEKFLGQPMILVNKPGSGGAVALAALANAPADGYTMSWANLPTLSIQPQMRKLTYDPRKLVYIATPMQYEYILYVSAKSPYKTLKDLVEAARKAPGKVRYGTPGLGTTNHLGVAWLANKENVRMTAVPFDGNPKAISAVVGGHCEAVNTSVTASISPYQAGLVRPLAVFSDFRIALLPDVPTLKELGYDFSQYSCLGAVFPPGTPDAVRQRMEDAIKYAIEQPDVQQRCAETLFAKIVFRNGAEYRALCEDYWTIWGDVLSLVGLKK